MQSVSSNAVARALGNTSVKRGTWGVLGGAKETSATTIEGLFDDVRGVGGICGGSINLQANSYGINAGWYNFIYIPHRSGLASEVADNPNYGNMLLFPMTTSTATSYKIQNINGTYYAYVL